MPITINLDDLTQEHVDRCAPNLGMCSYSAPCIIGTLMDRSVGLHDAECVGFLLENGVLEAPEDQWFEMIALQDAFDASDASKLGMMLAKRGLKWPSETV